MSTQPKPKTSLKNFGAGTSRLSKILTAKMKLAEIQPKTQLGMIANDIVVSTANTMLGVTAISGYCNALTEASLPIVTFTSGSPGIGITDQQLQQAWNTFQAQFAGFQGDAAAWVNPNSGSSILTQLTSLPANLDAVNGSVQSAFEILMVSEPGSDQYNAELDTLNTLIDAQVPAVTGLNNSMTQLGTQLNSAASTMVAATSDGGVLSQIITEYSDTIDQLNTNISNLQSQIDADNHQITLDSVDIAAGVADCILGVLGIAIIPVGFISIGFGIYGIVTASEDMELMKAQVAQDQTEIKNNTAWAQQDSMAAAAVSVFAGQVSNCNGLNSAAQQELTTLENLYTSLYNDLETALSHLAENPADAADALDEWNAVMAAAAPLGDLTFYIWPSPLMLTAPTGVAVTGSDFYMADVSGTVYLLDSSNTWTQLSDKALSITANSNGLYSINGAPADGSHVILTPYPTNYLGQTYNSTNDTWTANSTLPLANFASDGTTMVCITQQQTGKTRHLYKFNSGSNNWSKLTDLPNSATPMQCGVAGSKKFAIGNPGSLLYVYENNAWSQVGQCTCVSMSGNTNYLGFIDFDNNVWLYDVATGDVSETVTAGTANWVAQISTGDQYIILSDNSLNYCDNSQSPPVVTKLQQLAIAVYVSDADVAYFTDGNGVTHKLDGSPSSSNDTWTALPPLPTTS